MNNKKITCANCLRQEVYAADLEDLGYWCVIPSEENVDIFPTCRECAYYGGIGGITAFDVELPCAGRKPNRPIPFIGTKLYNVILPSGYINLRGTKEDYTACQEIGV